YQARGEIAQNISVEVGRDDDFEILRLPYKLKRSVIGEKRMCLNARIIARNLLKDAQEKTIGRLVNVRLLNAGNFPSPFAHRVLKGISDTPFAPPAGDKL